MFPDGRRVVSGSSDNTLKVWDVATGKCVATLEGHSDCVRCGVRCTFVMIWLRRRSWRCRVSGRAARRVWVEDDKTLKVWDVATGECVATLEGHSNWARCGVHCTFVMIWLRRRSGALPCFRTGGASCLRRSDKALKVWDVATGKCVATLEGHSKHVRCGVHCTFVMIWLRRRS